MYICFLSSTLCCFPSHSTPSSSSTLFAQPIVYKRMSHNTIRRSSSPIRKPSRTVRLFPSFTRAATYPNLPQSSFPISPNSCFTDDQALDHLLATSLPSRPSPPSPAYPIPTSPIHSEATQFPFLLPKPVYPLDAYQSMANPPPSPSRVNRSSRNNRNNRNNRSNRNTANTTGTNSNSNSNTNRRSTDRNSNNPPTTSRTNNRRRRSSSGASSNEPNSRRRSNNPPNESLRCDVCHQYYSRRDNLRVHQRVHTRVRPYQCRFCAQRFRWLGALRNHEANHIRDGDQALNPPPPDARQPTASSSRPSRSSEPTESPNSRSGRNHRSSSELQNTATHSAHRQPTSPRTQSTQQDHPSSSVHRDQRSSAGQRTSPVQPRRSHPAVPNLEIDLHVAHANTTRHVLITEDDPQISPMYVQRSHDNWDILDDIIGDQSRD